MTELSELSFLHRFSCVLLLHIGVISGQKINTYFNTFDWAEDIFKKIFKFLKQIEDTESCLRDLLARKEIVLALFAPDESEDDYNHGDYTDDEYYDDDYDHQVDHDQKDNGDGSGDYRTGIFCF